MITSKVFWVVLLATVAVYWLLPRWRAWFLFLSSFGYLAWVDLSDKDTRYGVVSLLGWCAVFYLASQKLKGKPRWVTLTLITAILGYLAYFKYIPSLLSAFADPEPTAAVAIIVPLGASYFTFKLIHYILESARGNIPKHGPETFLAYMFFFPIYAAGPIERFDAFLKDRAESPKRAYFVDGITRIIYGLIKKLVIVDLVLMRAPSMLFEPLSLADAIPLWSPPLRLEQLLQDLPTLHPLFAWQFVINQFVTTYVDFSAYCDIAIGAALLFGIKICENFDYPLLATNISDFWRRWHMSLSGWCQQYVYLPTLGRTRNPYIAVYASMAAIGVWHGGNLNFLLWGLYHATLLVVTLSFGRLKRRRKWKFSSPPLTVVAVLLTFLCVSAGHAFVSTTAIGVKPAFRILAKLVGVDVGV